MDSSRIALNYLRLVYPPVSSFEAEYIASDSEVKAVLEDSNFYMIAKRPQIFFGHPEISSDDTLLTLPLKMTLDTGETVEDCAEINLDELPSSSPHADITLSFDEGHKFFSIHEGSASEVDADRAPLLDWFTTEKLLFDRWRNKPGISGLHHLRKFTNYELLYVGISNENNTGVRLFSGSHEARQRILNNEFAIYGGGRISEEIYLFAFDIEPVSVRTLALTDRLTGHPGGPDFLEKKKVIADAEKAFIDLLGVKYNRTKYENYPKGKDGLHTSGLSGYMYQIAESITLVAENCTFRGDRDLLTGYPTNCANALVIRDELTTVFDPPDSNEGDDCSTD
ncbi:hypothetical protein DEU31_0773 [Brachybacterium sp. AG952]|uniref:hypothetical protein n=1 Tax=Brachybacterium sp. AG952 TaxID=2183989 RepID=UPI00105C09D3|nr:hypothetical protein [Brachybacterium sp. AG952]TDP80340.1 hypothetical protein DEU31_0773 [Brachybacterium sp. AG952]